MSAPPTSAPGYLMVPPKPLGSGPADWRHTEVIANGLRLHLVEAGDPAAPAVLLLHGFPEFWYAWKEQIGPLQRAGYRAIALDQRGYNRSDKPAGVAAYRTHHQVADVVGVLDALGIDRVTLIAHDWGAHVAWSVADQHPQRLRKLVVLNAAHPRVMTKNLIFNPRQTLRSWYAFMLQIPRAPEWVLGLRSFALLRRMIRWEGENGPMHSSDERLYIDAWRRQGAFSTMVNWYRAAFRSWPRLRRPLRITVPVLVLWGRRDQFLRSELATESLALCDDGRLVTFAEGSHWIHHEVPSEVNREIAEFLGPPVR